MEQLGIQPQLLIAQIVNFLLVMIVLNKLLYKPIITALEKRKQDIAEGLKLTDDMRVAADEAEAKKEKMLEAARRDAHKLLDEAKKKAKEQESELVAKAHDDAAKILEKAKQDAEKMVETAQKDIRVQAVELAALMVERVVPSVLSSQEQHTLLQKQLASLSLEKRN